MTTPQTLEEKLRAIVSGLMLNEHEWHDQHKANAVAQILQALESEHDGKATQIRNTTGFWLENTYMMSGQGWYDRFKAELDKEAESTYEPRQNLDYVRMMKAAKRAAGVSE
jgi:hypothetical protein